MNYSIRRIDRQTKRQQNRFWIKHRKENRFSWISWWSWPKYKNIHETEFPSLFLFLLSFVVVDSSNPHRKWQIWLPKSLSDVLVFIFCCCIYYYRESSIDRWTPSRSRRCMLAFVILGLSNSFTIVDYCTHLKNRSQPLWMGTSQTIDCRKGSKSILFDIERSVLCSPF